MRSKGFIGGFIKTSGIVGGTFNTVARLGGGELNTTLTGVGALMDAKGYANKLKAARAGSPINVMPS